MREYSGLSDRSLTLEHPLGTLVIERNSRKYDLGIICEDQIAEAMSLGGDLSFRELRDLIREINTREGVRRLERELNVSPYNLGMLPWETAYLHCRPDGTFIVEFPIPAPPEYHDPRFDIF